MGQALRAQGRAHMKKKEARLGKLNGSLARRLGEDAGRALQVVVRRNVAVLNKASLYRPVCS